jgi:hypothetical protein
MLRHFLTLNDLTGDELRSIIDRAQVLKAMQKSGEIYEPLKNKVLGGIKKNSQVDPWFFTNTSSIPLTELDEGANLDGNVIGFHRAQDKCHHIPYSTSEKSSIDVISALIKNVITVEYETIDQFNNESIASGVIVIPVHQLETFPLLSGQLFTPLPVDQLSVPLPFVFRYCPSVPSVAGNT